MNPKVVRLFASAACQVSQRGATYRYLLEKSQEFSDGFDGDADEVLFDFYAEQFARCFKPGMRETASELRAIAERNESFALGAFSSVVSLLQSEGAAVQIESAVAREPQTADEPVSRQDREAEKAEADRIEQERADALLNPPSVDAILIRDLTIDGRAKAAYLRSGLTTVGDLKTYAAAKPLDTVKGIGEDFAEETLRVIASLEKPAE